MTKPARDYEKMRPVILRALSLGSTPERICAKHMLDWATLMRHLRKWNRADLPPRDILPPAAGTAFADLPPLPIEKAAPMVAKEQNAERNDCIRRLRSEGKTPAQITRHLGISRNIVIGVLHRAGMTMEGEEKAKAVREGQRRGRQTTKARQKSPGAYQFGMGCTANATRLPGPRNGESAGPINLDKHYEPIPSHAVTIEHVTGCRWPFGDVRGEGIAYCNKPRCRVVVHGRAQPILTAYCDECWERRRTSRHTTILVAMTAPKLLPVAD